MARRNRAVASHAWLRADLTSASLYRANLTSALLGGANLTSADLGGAIVTQAQLDLACGTDVKLDPGLTLKKAVPFALVRRKGIPPRHQAPVELALVPIDAVLYNTL
jgi:hypothetical protein